MTSCPSRLTQVLTLSGAVLTCVVLLMAPNFAQSGPLPVHSVRASVQSPAISACTIGLSAATASAQSEACNRHSSSGVIQVIKTTLDLTDLPMNAFGDAHVAPAPVHFGGIIR